MKRLLPLLALGLLAFGCSGDDSVDADAGQDATVDAPHDTGNDVATNDAAKQDAGDAGVNDAAIDAPIDSALDAPSDAPDDSALDAGVMCDGGCTLFSYECKAGQFPACTCLALSGGEIAPTCDAGMVSCFKDPCLGKTPACVANQCIVQ